MTFSVLLSADRIEDDVYVSGFRVNQSSAPDAKAAGFQLGKTQMSEVQKQLGTPGSEDGKEIEYTWKRGNAIAEFTFESDTENAPLNKMQVVDVTPFLYGVGVSPEAGREENDLPNPEDLGKYSFILDGKLYGEGVTMAQLMENGWRLSAYDIGTELEPRGTSSVSTRSIVMYNGISFIEVSPYNNSTTDVCTIEEGNVYIIRVMESDCSSIWVEGGFTLGSKIKDIQKAFDDDIKTDNKSDYTNFSISKNNTRLRFSVADDTVFAIEVHIPIQW